MCARARTKWGTWRAEERQVGFARTVGGSWTQLRLRLCTWFESQIHLLRNLEELIEAGGHFSRRNDFAALLCLFFYRL